MACKYKVDLQLNGHWLWVVMPPFETVSDAEAWIAQEERRDRDNNRILTPYRITEDNEKWPASSE